MSKLSKPMGDPAFAPFILRVSLGLYLVLAGRLKIDTVQEFVKVVKDVSGFPDHLAIVYATSLPYIQIFAGALLILGLWTTLGALLSSYALITTFLIFAAPTFKADYQKWYGDMTLLKELVVVVASLSILYSGSGAFSFDRLRKSD
ncbi:MAG TPA: DoxX family protein [Oligoflexia bacterium]|nr:DoxX family protein [Oligoflexia bacterium]